MCPAAGSLTVMISNCSRRCLPLVRTNPRNGRLALYIGVLASHALSMPGEPGRQLVNYLIVYIGQQCFAHS